MEKTYRSAGGGVTFVYPSDWIIAEQDDDFLIIQSFRPRESADPETGFSLGDGMFKIDISFGAVAPDDRPGPGEPDCRSNMDLNQGPPVEVKECRIETINGRTFSWVLKHEEVEGSNLVFQIGTTTERVTFEATAFIPDGREQEEGRRAVERIYRSVRLR